MKWTLILSLNFLLLLNVGRLSAQEFSIGPKLGVSQGNIKVNGTEFSSGNEKLGYHLGLFARLGGNRIFIQPEVLYTNTGGEFYSQQNNTNITYTASFDRLDIPMMAGFKFARVLRVQAGPVMTFILDSEFTSSGQSIVDPDYNSSTLGYQAGIGLDIANMILDFKYEGALGKHADSIAGLQTDQRQNQIMVSLGIRLF
ncbi:MAG: porin family protein, partial [Cyclobacteriaceae bacterium]